MPPPQMPHHQQPLSRNHPTTTTTNTTATATQTLTSTPVLRLRARVPSPQDRRRIQWAEDVVDNEGLGRKRSKGWYLVFCLRLQGALFFFFAVLECLFDYEAKKKD